MFSFKGDTTESVVINLKNFKPHQVLLGIQVSYCIMFLGKNIITGRGLGGRVGLLASLVAWTTSSWLESTLGTGGDLPLPVQWKPPTGVNT